MPKHAHAAIGADVPTNHHYGFALVASREAHGRGPFVVVDDEIPYAARPTT